MADGEGMVYASTLIVTFSRLIATSLEVLGEVTEVVTKAHKYLWPLVELLILAMEVVIQQLIPS